MVVTEQLAELRDPFASGLTHWDLLEMYGTMVMARALYERMWLLNRSGKAPFIVTGEGHEAAQVGSAYAVREGYDFMLPYYRDLGVVLTLGMTPQEVMLNLFNRAADPNGGGRQMPSHWSHPDLRIVSHSSPVATHILHAVGIAHAARIKGEDTVAMAYFGDGATSKGDFHEGLNWAAVFKLPVIFVCENNGYAISVPSSRQVPVKRVAQRASAYGIPGVTVDGGDVVEVFEATQEAVSRARRGEGPTLIEAVTYRFKPHTSNDDDSVYRSREEVEAARKRDPITRLRAYLLKTGALSEEEDEAIKIRIRGEIDEAEAFAEASPLPRPEDALLYVCAESSTAANRELPANDGEGGGNGG
ncbi:MAG: thiamine pyrophosphate-dependent dehydrogenase E1 component subunit alpha [Chloroflexi bacterium]|nr:thiamine pyrophosphate-dependent dehydrogenase E1 component subunit alpha [Chloroflexota bacterium]